jgi:hypothetical protein
VVEVHRDEGVAIHIGPEPCVYVRESKSGTYGSVRGRSAMSVPTATRNSGLASVCHFQLKPGVFLGFGLRYCDRDPFAQSIEIAEQAFVSISGKMPAHKFRHIRLAPRPPCAIAR